jgi:hypothetical protein
VFKSFSDTFDYISAQRCVVRVPGVTRRRVMTQAQLAATLAGCVNQQINQEQRGNITLCAEFMKLSSRDLA